MSAVPERDSAASHLQAREAAKALQSSWFITRDRDALDIIERVPDGVWPDHIGAEIASVVRKTRAEGRDPDELTVGRALTTIGVPVSEFASYTQDARPRHSRSEFVELVEVMILHRTRLDIASANQCGSPEALVAIREILARADEWRLQLDGPVLLSRVDIINAPDPAPPVFRAGIWPGTVSELIGESGRGKSWATLHMAASACTGHDYGLPAFHCKNPGNVLLASYEDDPSVLRDRLSRIVDDNCDRVLWAAVEDGSLFFVDDLNEPMLQQRRPGEPVERTGLFRRLENTIRELKPVLVVLDPLSAVVLLANESDNSGMAQAAAIFADLAKRTGTAILLVHHSSKAGAGTPSQHSSRGASALACRCRWIGHLTFDPDANDLTLWPVKYSYGKTPSPVPLAQQGTGPLRQIALGSRDPREIIAALIQVLEGNPDLDVEPRALGRKSGTRAAFVIDEVQALVPWCKPKDISDAAKMGISSGVLALGPGKNTARSPIQALRIPATSDNITDEEVPF